MASNRQFILLIFGVKLDDIRAALGAQNHGKGAISALPAPLISSGDTLPSPGTSASAIRSNGILGSATLIDYANYMPLPRSFVNLRSHPKQTNLLCWNCGLPFNRVPRFMALDSTRVLVPHATDSVMDDTLEWAIDGNFCSWACSAAYIDEHFQDPKKWSLLQNLAVVRAQSDGGRIRPIKRAPQRTQMRSYSGGAGITQQEYADLVETLSQT